MKVGTKSVLFGAHCFFLHPWFVAAAWWKLFGFPWDPRPWVAFFVHDIGYWGMAAMDDEIGETHPEFGARIMGRLFDPPPFISEEIDPACREYWIRCCEAPFAPSQPSGRWYLFTLLHSRYYAKRLGKKFSQLCLADKLSFCLTPRWLYLPMVNWTGEIHEYLKMAHHADMTGSGKFKAADYRGRQRDWHIELCRYMRDWVDAHKDGAEDTWTSANRHARTDSGVWQ